MSSELCDGRNTEGLTTQTPPRGALGRGQRDGAVHRATSRSRQHRRQHHRRQYDLLPPPPPKFSLPVLTLPRTQPHAAQRQNSNATGRGTLSSLSTVHSTRVSSDVSWLDGRAGDAASFHQLSTSFSDGREQQMHRQPVEVLPAGNKASHRIRQSSPSSSIHSAGLCRGALPPHDGAAHAGDHTCCQRSKRHSSRLFSAASSTTYTTALHHGAERSTRSRKHTDTGNGAHSLRSASLAPSAGNHSSHGSVNGTFRSGGSTNGTVRSLGSSASPGSTRPVTCAALICCCLAKICEPEKCVIDQGEVEILSFNTNSNSNDSQQQSPKLAPAPDNHETFNRDPTVPKLQLSALRAPLANHNNDNGTTVMRSAMSQNGSSASQRRLGVVNLQRNRANAVDGDFFSGTADFLLMSSRLR